ncbi:preprotein translocase subunit SecY [Candidatus Parcubacteria bacterium]|nr:preprotein translocase subunit SecY [Candidatus Parcubacteria bacterium]
MELKQIFLAFKVKDLRKKILFILLIFAIFRFLAAIPIPAIDRYTFKEILEKSSAFLAQYGFFRLLNVFTGGALERFSIVMLGLGPYITATIILQLLTLMIPSLEKMYKEGGREGREKFEQYGRILTVPLSMLQGFAMIRLWSQQKILPHLSLLETLSSVFAISGATLLLMWLGELISEKGLGNGVSLLIFAGIAADFPTNIGALITTFQAFQILNYLIFFLMVILILTSVVIVNEARRNIPINYTKRVRGTRLFGGVSTFLPISLNPAGVIPIIFAISLLTFPPTIAQFLVQNPGILGKIAKATISFFENQILYSILYFLLVFVFTYFYTSIVFDPKSLAENLQKFGGFISGIRPGPQTANYLSFVLNRILLFGGIFLGLIAIMPSIVQAITKVGAFRFLTGGTSLLILVSVVLETAKAIQAELESREYDTI